MSVSPLSYQDRIPYAKAPIAKQLLQLMEEKKTNLALSADVTKASELIALAAELGPEICLLKTHIDIIEDFTPSLTQTLSQLAHQHQFLIFEDRKFADIGNTVKHQYEGGIYRIADWADLTNAHSLPGPGIIHGLYEAGHKKNRGLLLLAEMSSAGHFMDQDYIKNTLHMAESFPDFVIGFITQHALSPHPGWIYFTPGVKREAGSDSLLQQYVTPEKAIYQQGSDIIIVGRGILSAKNPLIEAQCYRQQAFDAYLKRCQQSKQAKNQ